MFVTSARLYGGKRNHSRRQTRSDSSVTLSHTGRSQVSNTHTHTTSQQGVCVVSNVSRSISAVTLDGERQEVESDQAKRTQLPVLVYEISAVKDHGRCEQWKQRGFYLLGESKLTSLLFIDNSLSELSHIYRVLLEGRGESSPVT